MRITNPSKLSQDGLAVRFSFSSIIYNYYIEKLSAQDNFYKKQRIGDGKNKKKK